MHNFYDIIYLLSSLTMAGPWGVQGAQWNRVSPSYGPQKKIIAQ
jgi:hypothetical protein